MDDNELYNLAVQAGMIPSGQLAQQPAPAPAPAPEQGLAEQFPHDQGAVVSPDAPAVSTPADPYKRTSNTQDYSASASTRGFDAAKYDAIGKSVDKGLAGGLAAADAKAAAEGQTSQANELAVHSAKVNATKAVADATANKIVEEGHQAALYGNLQRSFADEEAKANMMAEEQSKQGMANYVAALADFRATKIDPGQLWGSLNGAQRVGTLAAVFAHDFLGAQGVHTTAMDTLNRAIDRNISAQEQALKTKGEVAEGFKSLWYMQRNQSASDAEARARMRGLMIESAKQQIIANMAGVESGLATAQGQAAMAKLDEESAKTLFEIKKHIDANAQGMRNEVLQAWKAKLDAANTSYANALHAREIAQREKFHQDQLNKEKGGPTGNSFLVDPETNKVKWVLRDGTSEKAIDKVKEMVINTVPFNDAVKQLREFERTLPPTFDLIKGTRLSNEQQRQYTAIQYQLAHSMVKANGERATDKDVDQYMASIPVDTYFTNGGVARILANTQRFGLVTPQAWIQQYADDVPEGFQHEGPKNQIFGGSKTDATAVATGQDKIKDRETVNLEKDLGRLQGPHSTESVDEPGAYALDAHKTFTDKYPQFGGEIGALTKPGEVTEFEMGAIHLAQAAKETTPDGNLTPNAVRAREALKREADSYTNNNFPGNDMDWRGAYAAFILTTLGEHDTSFPSKDPGRPDTSPGPVTSTYESPFGK